MANYEIREQIRKNRLFHYEIADRLGGSESRFSQMLRKELTVEQKQRVMSAIEAIRTEGEE